MVITSDDAQNRTTTYRRTMIGMELAVDICERSHASALDCVQTGEEIDGVALDDLMHDGHIVSVGTTENNCSSR